MPGFFGFFGIHQNSNLKNTSNKINDKSFSGKDYYVESHTISKFQKDKVFYNDEDFLVLTEGVILNSKDLINKFKQNSLIETILFMYQTIGNDFFKDFRGSFSGVFFDKKNNRKIIFTNHIGDKQIFYCQGEDEIIFGSEINYLVKYFKDNQLIYTFNKKAAYYLLTFGFMLEDNTLFNEYKKLIPGNYIIIENGKFNIVEYYKLDNSPKYEETENEIIENIDRLFRQAIKRAFEKDIEYGYKHLVALSGGLDSRMTTWVAHDMGYGKNIVNYTFSQSDYIDEVIPKQIARDLKHQWIFKALDNGEFLKDIDDTVKICAGNALYYGLAHGKSCLELLNISRFGIIHSGQLGDVILGTFYSSKQKNKMYTLMDGAYSKVLSTKLKQKDIDCCYENEEIYKFYNRGFNGANQGLTVAQENFETYSPFYDLDFLEYCLSIPVEFRFNHYIYFKWILSKYPQAGNYIWEKINGKITDWKINIFNKQILIKRLPQKTFNYVLKKLKLKHSLNSKNHMNPLDYWYNNNKDLKKFMDDYFIDNIDKLNFDIELKNDSIYLYKEGNTIEKNQVLTLLFALKLYFNDKL